MNNLSVCNKYGKKYTWKIVVFINLSNRIRRGVKIRVFCIFRKEKYSSIYIKQQTKIDKIVYLLKDETLFDYHVKLILIRKLTFILFILMYIYNNKQYTIHIKIFSIFILEGYPINCSSLILCRSLLLHYVNSFFYDIPTQEYSTIDYKNIKQLVKFSKQ